MAQQTWFVVRGGKETGPYSGTQLKDMAATGKLKPTDQVRRADVETARPASAIKGLFPTAGSDEGTTSPRQPPDEPQKKGMTKKKWIVIGSVIAAVLFLSCGGMMLGGFLIINAERKAAQKDFAEAGVLWDAGKKSEAAAKYRSALKGLRGEERTVAYGRLIDFECEAGNVEAAKTLMADASKAKVTPAVNHPEAKSLLAGQAITPQPGGAALAQGDGLTADYLPCIAGNVKHYEEERYDFDTGRPANRSTNKITYHGDNKLTLEWSTVSPGQVPTTGKGPDKIEVKNGIIEWVGRIVIKVGAKPGDEWPSPRGRATYKLVRFEKGEAKGGDGKVIELHRAVIESKLVSDDGRGGKMEHLTEYVLEKGGGIQSEKEYMTARGKKVLIRDRRLVSSSYQ